MPRKTLFEVWTIHNTPMAPECACWDDLDHTCGDAFEGSLTVWCRRRHCGMPATAASSVPATPPRREALDAQSPMTPCALSRPTHRLGFRCFCGRLCHNSNGRPRQCWSLRLPAVMRDHPDAQCLFRILTFSFLGTLEHYSSNEFQQTWAAYLMRVPLSRPTVTVLLTSRIAQSHHGDHAKK